MDITITIDDVTEGYQLLIENSMVAGNIWITITANNQKLTCNVPIEILSLALRKLTAI